jgi:hypothetical protein
MYMLSLISNVGLSAVHGHCWSKRVRGNNFTCSIMKLVTLHGFLYVLKGHNSQYILHTNSRYERIPNLGAVGSVNRRFAPVSSLY